MKWNDISWNTGMIRVDESRCISGKEYIDKRPKSENGIREVIAPEYLLGLLKATRKTELASERIFSLRPDKWSSRFATLVRKHNWPSMRFHDLRHYHASWLYENNIPDQYAAQRLGHDVQILKSIYQHLGANKRQEIDSNLRQLQKK